MREEKIKSQVKTYKEIIPHHTDWPLDRHPYLIDFPMTISDTIRQHGREVE